MTSNGRNWPIKEAPLNWMSPLPKNLSLAKRRARGVSELLEGVLTQTKEWTTVERGDSQPPWRSRYILASIISWGCLALTHSNLMATSWLSVMSVPAEKQTNKSDHHDHHQEKGCHTTTASAVCRHNRDGNAWAIPGMPSGLLANSRGRRSGRRALPRR